MGMIDEGLGYFGISSLYMHSLHSMDVNIGMIIVFGVLMFGICFGKPCRWQRAAWWTQMNDGMGIYTFGRGRRRAGQVIVDVLRTAYYSVPCSKMHSPHSFGLLMAPDLIAP